MKLKSLCIAMTLFASLPTFAMNRSVIASRVSFRQPLINRLASPLKIAQREYASGNQGSARRSWQQLTITTIGWAAVGSAGTLLMQYITMPAELKHSKDWNAKMRHLEDLENQDI